MNNSETTTMDSASQTELILTLQKDVRESMHRLDVVEDLLSETKDVLTVEEAAKFLGLTKSFVYKMTHEGTIPYYKPNGKICYFEKSELLKWLRQNKVPSKEEVAAAAKEEHQEPSAA